MEWMEIKVLTTTEAADLISEILLEMGSEGTVIEDRNDVFANQRPEGQWDIIDPAIADRIGEDVKVSGFFPADERLGDALAALRERLRRLGETAGELPLGKLEIVMNDFEDEDWSQSWKRAFQPVRLGEHFVVRPGWIECPLEAGDREIVIDPGLAFGTGTHETTGMCMALVEKYVRPGMTVIDIFRHRQRHTGHRGGAHGRVPRAGDGSGSRGCARRGGKRARQRLRRGDRDALRRPASGRGRGGRRRHRQHHTVERCVAG